MNYQDLQKIQKESTEQVLPQQKKVLSAADKIRRKTSNLPDPTHPPMGWKDNKGYDHIFPWIHLPRLHPRNHGDTVIFNAPEKLANQLILGDNLEVLRTLASESIDLIYIDPPFFSGRNYNVIWGDTNEVRSFYDIWEGGIDSYLVWLNARLWEMRRVLKKTGSVYVHCFYPDTPILMADFTLREIKEVKAGDKLISENNKQNKVIRTYKRPYKGKMLEIRYMGNIQPIRVTPEHNFFVIKKEWRDEQRKRFGKIQKGVFNKEDIKKIRAGEIKVGDYLILTPNNQLVENIKSVPVGKIVRRSHPLAAGIPENIAIDKRLMRWMGYYLAEGMVDYSSITGNPSGINFTVGLKEKDIQEEIVSLTRNIFGLKVVRMPIIERHGMRLKINSNPLGKLIKNFCGTGAKNKALSPLFMSLPPELQYEIFDTWAKGDGWQYKGRRNENSIIVNTISEKLAYQMYLILLRNKKSPRLEYGKNPDKIAKNHHPLYRIVLPLAEKNSPRHWVDENYLVAPVISKEEFYYEGDVCNLEVEEEHSYFANLVKVSNCDWHASHYIKTEMDKIFGYDLFVNEIIWKYHAGTTPRKGLGKKHDIIFHYIKNKEDWIFNQWREPIPEHLQKYYKFVDKDGRKYRLGGSDDSTKYYLDEGRASTDVWVDINIINKAANERIGYPTQKPEVLLERIIKASSNEGDVVADFFCGGGTTLACAQKLKRNFIGCDSSRVAISVSLDRLVKVGEEMSGVKSNVSKAEKFQEGLGIAKEKVPNIEVSYLGVYPTEKFASIPQNDFCDFVLTCYGASKNTAQGVAHGFRPPGQSEPILIGPADPKESISGQEVKNFFDEIKNRLEPNKLVNAKIIGWRFSRQVVEYIKILEDYIFKNNLPVKLELIPLDSNEFRARVLQRYPDASDAEFFLRFSKTPVIGDIKVKKVKDLEYEFEAIDAFSTNEDGWLVNCQWDFDYDEGHFTADDGYVLSREKIKDKKRGEQFKAILKATYKLEKSGEHTIACKIQDNLAGETIFSKKIKI